MRGFEREIEEAAYQRSAPVQKQQLGMLRRMENLAIDNMSGLAIGSAGAVVGLAVMLSVSSPTPRHLAALDPVTVGSIDSPARVPKAQDWKTSRKPVEIVSLQAPQFDRVPTVYTSRSNAQGDQEDTLLWQTASHHLPEARISMVRRPNGGMAQSLFIEMTRQQAERGLAVARSGMPGPLKTKFGAFEVADMIFSDDAEREQACLAFRSSTDKATISISGWFCAPKGAAAERPEVACFIDRLSLLKSGEDKDLRRFFTESEQRRKPCPTTRISTGRKPTWLDVDGKAPAMRDDVTGSITNPRKK